MQDPQDLEKYQEAGHVGTGTHRLSESEGAQATEATEGSTAAKPASEQADLTRLRVPPRAGRHWQGWQTTVRLPSSQRSATGAQRWWSQPVVPMVTAAFVAGGLVGVMDEGATFDALFNVVGVSDVGGVSPDEGAPGGKQKGPGSPGMVLEVGERRSPKPPAKGSATARGLGKATFLSHPQGAEVLRNDVLLGVTPVVVEASSAEPEIYVVRKPGYASSVLRVRIDRSKVINTTLRALEDGVERD